MLKSFSIDSFKRFVLPLPVSLFGDLHNFNDWKENWLFLCSEFLSFCQQFSTSQLPRFFSISGNRERSHLFNLPVGSGG
jgi:hypothetical protein